MHTRWLRTALGAVLFAALHLSAVAQEPGTRPQGPPPGRGPGHNPEQQAADLTKKLKLNDKQQGEVTAIFKNQQQQLEALRGSKPPTDADREKGMEQMRRVDTDTDARLKAVLTPAQYNQYLAQKPQPGGPKGGKADKVKGKGARPPKDATGSAAN